MKLQILAALIAATAPALAHDTWVETNTNVYRVGDVAHIDLKLGNHGNDHRDFKLAAFAPLESTKIEVIAPDGKPTQTATRFLRPTKPKLIWRSRTPAAKKRAK